MFCKCLDCGAVHVDPELNSSHCPFCGSEKLMIVKDKKERVTLPVRYKINRVDLVPHFELN